MLDASGWLVLGVDPAPKKDTVAFDGRSFHIWPAKTVRGALRTQVEQARGEGRSVLVLWDAPIRMDEGSFYGRRVDTDAKAIVKRWMRERFVGGMNPLDPKERRAVGIAAAAQCPHNLLSMHVLGLPMGAPRLGLKPLTDPVTLRTGGAWVAEVHPAVAIGAIYAHHRLGTLLRYKGDARRSREILDTLLAKVDGLARLIPTDTADALGSHQNFGDDELDAFVAWLLGRMLLAGEAVLWCGLDEEPPETRGHYVMPSNTEGTTLSLELPYRS